MTSSCSVWYVLCDYLCCATQQEDLVAREKRRWDTTLPVRKWAIVASTVFKQYDADYDNKLDTYV